ncbi:hypothetical protein [Streptomyces sp. NPDC060194]|uniref:hypothetical protein n=1 Tax=Streptomyces sp. NPDC060194 TaxID=3347069 RepID=UPI003648756F
MTYPPYGGQAQPGQAASAPPAPAAPAVVPPQPAAALPLVSRQAPAYPPASAPGGEPPRRTAWSEGVDRLRAGATTEPGRLRIIGAVLAALVVAFGAVTSLQMDAREASATSVVEHSQPLTADAASIYSSLADANTAASSGFLAEGPEPAKAREAYERGIRNASQKLAGAASNAGRGSSAAAEIAKLNRLLPEYERRVQTARVYDRQGLPLGGAWLRNANDLMQQEMLPVAENLYTAEKARLDADYEDAKAYPWAALALGVLAVGALLWAQRRNFLHTNRVLNHGLLGATVAAVAVLLWLAAGHTLARAQLGDSYDNGVRSLNVLNEARISSLKARGNENLTLVARGAVTVPDKDPDVQEPHEGEDFYDVEYQRAIGLLPKEQRGLGQLLDRAAELAGKGDGGARAVADAGKAMKVWKERHSGARTQDAEGDYEAALSRVIGEEGSTGECFEEVDRALEKALAFEQRQFETAAGDGRGAMTGLPLGAVVVALLGAAGALLGVGRRLSEYR